ncbi:MAG: DUF2500 domain-containing protein [Clostridia bacterium]|nr:DUF2500 domain-containing protein [Clostridia bacterium]
MKFFVFLFPIMVILIILGAVVLLFRMMLAGASTYIKTPTQKNVNATVIGKRKQDMMRSSGAYTNYFVLFDLGQNDRLEFPVSKHLYKKCNPGDTGKLSYKGSIFLSFALDRELPPPPPKKETYILNGEVVEK